MIREYADEPIVFAAFQQHQQECKIGKNPCKASNVFELVQNSALARFDGETIRTTLSVACPVADNQQGLSVAALRARLTKVRRLLHVCHSSVSILISGRPRIM